MKNYLKYILTNKIKITVNGNNIDRFIKRLYENNIDILKLKIKKYNSIEILIYKKDYDKLLEIKTIYELEIMEYHGIIKLRDKVLKNKFIILSILLFFIIEYILSNMIFSIDVLSNDYDLNDSIILELKNYNIKKYQFKKTYNEIQIIKKEILDKYKDKIEWLEIESKGTKYVIKYEPRIMTNKSTLTYRNIIAKKDGIISSMNISNGNILKLQNEYVKKGDIIVSGYIDLNGNIKDTVISTGCVYAEVWYNVQVTYPYRYYEKNITGKQNKVLVLKILNKEIELFNFNKYLSKDVKNKILIKNNIFPISLNYQTQYETKVIDKLYTDEEAINNAVKTSIEKINSNLKDKEYIKDYKILNTDIYDEYVSVNIFFSVVEDITEYQEIEKYVENEN